MPAIGLQTLILATRCALAADEQAAADVTTPVVLTGSEHLAMGGAGIGLASGAGGLYFSPSGLAVRPVEDTAFFYPTGTASWITVPPKGNVDLGNTGELRPGWSGGLLNLGGGLHLGRYGVGIALQGLFYSEDSQRIGAVVGRLGLASGLAGGRLAVGAGLRTLSLELDDGETTQRFGGAAPEVGILYAEGKAGWNLGLALRAPVRAPRSDDDGEGSIDTAVLPWQAALGAGWVSESSTRASPRRAWRFAADLVVDGAITDAVGLYPLLEGNLVEKGDHVTFSPRAGAEWEVIPRRLRLRGGSYLEPGRIQRDDCPDALGEEPLCGTRLHGTAGFEVRLFHMRWLWGIIDHDITWETSIDHANRFTNVGWLGIGTWKSGEVGPYQPSRSSSRVSG